MRLPNGYEMESTFWYDFSIADIFGERAIRETYERAFNEWKDDIKYMTELTIALNYKIWEWYEKDEDIAKVYNELWEQIEEYILGDDTKFSEDEITYFYRITD